MRKCFRPWWAVGLFAVMSVVGEAAENQGKLQIVEFSISPLEVSSGQQIDLKWRVVNSGSVSLTVQPLVQFINDTTAHVVTPSQPPQRLAPGQEFTFTATARPQKSRAVVSLGHHAGN